MSSYLESLCKDSIAKLSMVIATPRALREELRKQPEIINTVKAVHEGTVTYDDISKFVRDLLKHFNTGERFRFDSSLCALAVIVNYTYGIWSDNFLNELAKLKVQEIQLSPRIAQLCLNERDNFLCRDTTSVSQLKKINPIEVGLYEEISQPTSSITNEVELTRIPA